MTRVLYGFSGEGSGHSSRAREMMRRLQERGHEVVGASYDRGYANLRGDFDDLPLVTLDNQHRMRYLRYPIPPGLRKDALVTEAVIRAMVPRPDVSLVTTFWFGEPTNDRTFLFPPILRREVLAATSSDPAAAPRGDAHVLVYFTRGFDAFLDHLRACPRERFVVYGTGREGTEGNLEHRSPSRDGFLEALAGAKAVIATAGFTLLTEALHLESRSSRSRWRGSSSRS